MNEIIKENELKEAVRKVYIKCQKEAGFKVGDKVKVMCTAKSQKYGWSNAWVAAMTENIGRLGKITRISDRDIQVAIGDHGWGYPYYVLEKMPDPETYKIGQKFKRYTGTVYVLCSTGLNKIGLIDPETGRRWGNRTEVKDTKKITREEMIKHTSSWGKFTLVEE